MLIQADARSIPLRDGCVQCVVTSPPYYGLRDYGVAGQLGLEGSPDAYVGAITAVMAEVRRVLKDDGVVWLNLGDSYTSMLRSGRDESPGVGAKQEMSPVRNLVKWGKGGGTNFWWRVPAFGSELKPKDLMGIPWRVAFALQADGWYLRSDIIWSKPNPMPESVTDRPTKAHEYLFLLTKSEHYYYDAAAIREPYAASTLTQFENPYEGKATKEYAAVGVQNPSTVKKRITDKQRGHSRRHAGFNDRWDARVKEAYEVGERTNPDRRDGGLSEIAERGCGANKRSVWTIPTTPYAGAHFATMPEKLVEPCILAGSRFGDLIFDPFSGSGTVLAVAQRLGRRAVGTDLNPAYHELAKKRTAQRGLRFESVEIA